MKKTVIGILVTCLGGAASAGSTATPVGLWKTADDSGKEMSHVRITEQSGMLVGRIEKLIDAPSPNPTCDKCTDERKGQPLLGLTIIRGVQHGEDGSWGGGDILDPLTGKVFSLLLKPDDSGKKLTVRGYVGAPVLGRNQVWSRVE